jgi:ABC-type lipoprotein release transport system permease subunit
MIVMTSIIVGCAAVMLYDAIAVGFTRQKFDTEISNHTTHFQINKKGFNDNKVIGNRIDNPEAIENTLKKLQYIEHYSPRVMSYGMLSSAENSSGVTIIGINPELEKHTTSISKSIIKGRYLRNTANEIVIGREAADKLAVGLNDKVIMIVAASDGSVQSEMFRIAGIFNASSSEFNRTYSYINIETAQRMLMIGNAITQFAVIGDNKKLLDENKKKISKVVPKDIEVLSFADIMPLSIMYIEMADQMMIIMYVIIGIAVLFGIINTMLMSVFERIQEFGVLMSIGMKRSKIFLMVIFEAFFIGTLGTISGFIIGFGFYLIIARTGIDLSAFAEGLNSFGIKSLIYPILSFDIVIRAVFVIPTITIIGAIYPAQKAIRLLPTEAMRHI